MFRLLCINNVTKTDIYSERVEQVFLSSPASCGRDRKAFLPPFKPQEGLEKCFCHCLNLDSLDLRINLIDFGKLVETNKSLNTAFAELMRERVDEGSVKVDIVLKKARLHLDEAYYAIVERVNALVVVEGVADYESFIRKLNISIAKYNLLATQASRKPGKRGGGKKATTGGSYEER